MGLIPATGSTISMGRVHRAFGLSPGYPPAAGSNIGLNSTLGANRSPPRTTGTTAIPGGTQTGLSQDFGGITTAEDYPA